MRPAIRRFAPAALWISFAASPSAATYTVTTTADSGAGSLRQAITDANGSPGHDDIAFNITGSGVHTIAPATALPTITDQVTIDGYTQPGASANTNGPSQGTNAVIQIEIDGYRARLRQQRAGLQRRERHDPGPRDQPLPRRGNPGGRSGQRDVHPRKLPRYRPFGRHAARAAGVRRRD